MINILYSMCIFEFPYRNVKPVTNKLCLSTQRSNKNCLSHVTHRTEKFDFHRSYRLVSDKIVHSVLAFSRFHTITHSTRFVPFFAVVTNFRERIEKSRRDRQIEFAMPHR